jgi:hypothetical protein
LLRIIFSPSREPDHYAETQVVGRVEPRQGRWNGKGTGVKTLL